MQKNLSYQGFSCVPPVPPSHCEESASGGRRSNLAVRCEKNCEIASLRLAMTPKIIWGCPSARQSTLVTNRARRGEGVCPCRADPALRRALRRSAASADCRRAVDAGPAGAGCRPQRLGQPAANPVTVSSPLLDSLQVGPDAVADILRPPGLHQLLGGNRRWRLTFATLAVAQGQRGTGKRPLLFGLDS